MDLLTVAEAKTHLRVIQASEDALIAIYSAAAEQVAVSFLNRAVYADSGALATAIASAPSALTTATQTYEDAIGASDAVADETERTEAIRVAGINYLRARIESRQAHDGIVINELIKSAMLLICGHLYANRENSVVGVSSQALPMGAYDLLGPFRVGPGQ